MKNVIRVLLGVIVILIVNLLGVLVWSAVASCLVFLFDFIAGTNYFSFTSIVALGVVIHVFRLFLSVIEKFVIPTNRDE